MVKILFGHSLLKQTKPVIKRELRDQILAPLRAHFSVIMKIDFFKIGIPCSVKIILETFSDLLMIFVMKIYVNP